jgi:hypothetical protein
MKCGKPSGKCKSKTQKMSGGMKETSDMKGSKMKPMEGKMVMPPKKGKKKM